MQQAGVPARPQQVRAGVISMLIFTLVFAVMVASGKSGVARFSFVEVVWIRCVVALAVLLAAARFMPGGVGLAGTRRPWMHLRLGLAMTGNLLFYFLSLRLLPMNEAVLLSFCSGLFITALSVPMLGERVGPHRWAAVLVGFAGVAVIAGPGRGLLAPGTLVALGSALFSGLCWLTVRQMSATESSLAMTVSMLLTTVVVTGLALPWFWEWPRAADWPVLVLVGVAGGLAQWLISHAYRLAPAAIMAPFNYFQEVWAAIFAWVIWREVPAPRTLLGGALIIGAGLYALARETRRRVAA